MNFWTQTRPFYSICESFRIIKSIIFSVNSYCARNKGMLLYVGLILMVAYGVKLANFYLSIDTERAMVNNSFQGWILQGRYGIYAIRKIFHMSPFVPYASDVFSVFFLGYAGILWNYLLKKVMRERIGNYKDYIFTGLFISMPSLAEMMLFSTFNAEVTLGMIFSGICAYCGYRWISGGRHSYAILSVLFLWFLTMDSTMQAEFTEN